MPATGYRDALRSSPVRRLWFAAVISTIGDYVGLGALLFLAADRTGVALGTAGVLAVGVIPSLLTGVVAGPWLDRFDRRRALASLQLIGAGVICLPVLIDGAVIVFATAALLAGVRIATVAVRSGAMAEGVHDHHRGALVALLSSTDQGSQVIGYLTGGALYVVLGAEVALLVDAASFVLAALVLSQLRLPRSGAREERRPIGAGIADIVRDPVLRLLASLVLVTGLVASLPEVLAPSVAGPGDPLRPVVLAAGPAGQVIAMTLLGRTAHVRRPLVQLTHLTLLGIALMIAALGRTPAAIAAANLLVGAGTAWIVGPQVVFLHRAPNLRMGQITGTMVAGLAVADGVGSLSLAGLADLAGIQAAYAAGALTVVVAAAIGWATRTRTEDLLELDESPLADDEAAFPNGEAAVTQDEATFAESELGPAEDELDT